MHNMPIDETIYKFQLHFKKATGGKNTALS